MCCKTKQLGRSRRAGCRCLETASRPQGCHREIGNSNRRGDKQMMCGAWYATTADAAGVPPGELKGCLSRATSLYLLASITVSFLASTSAPTPLYPIYQGEWGFSATAISFVFGIYAIAVLGALLVAGRLSDYVGRRPVLIVATAIQAA